MGKKLIWAPWRAQYILGKKEKGCIFCNRFRARSDAGNLIVYRGLKTFVILNRFPYNSGHSMVVPNRHIRDLSRMTEEEAFDFFETVRLTVDITRKVFGPDSFNIGMNMGRGSGAGVPGHVHMHIVPRWNEDTNFMPVIGDTEVVSFPLDMIFEKLRKGFDDLCLVEKSRPKRS